MRIEGLGLVVEGLVFRIQGLALRVEGSTSERMMSETITPVTWFRIFRLRFWGLGFRVQGVGFRVQGAGLRVQGLELTTTPSEKASNAAS